MAPFRAGGRAASLTLMACTLGLVLAQSALAQSNPTQDELTRSKSLKKLKVDVKSKGTSSKKIRAKAIKELPLDKLDRDARRAVDDILRRESLYRRLPTISFETNAHVYEFFAKHPDVAVSIWRAMKISKFEMWQTGKYTYEADAGDGSVGVIQVLHQDKEKHLIVCEGVYKSPLLVKPIKARSLIYLRTAFSKDKQGKGHVTHRADLFISLPSTTVETAAKIISPVSNMIADRNFREVSLFVHMMSLACTHQPKWVEQLATRLDGVLGIRKSQLTEMTHRAHAYEQKRHAALREVSQNPSDDSSVRQTSATPAD